MSLTDKERKEKMKESLIECFGFIPDNLDLEEMHEAIKIGESNGYSFDFQMSLVKSMSIFKKHGTNR